jgi:hypothetical protein
MEKREKMLKKVEKSNKAWQINNFLVGYTLWHMRGKKEWRQ